MAFRDPQGRAGVGTMLPMIQACPRAASMVQLCVAKGPDTMLSRNAARQLVAAGCGWAQHPPRHDVAGALAARERVARPSG